ncbi:triose-phosphate isomerase family protein [Actinomadura sp. WMMB 499]|uniref:triose-phosphate isomerase family protein n=1 Tax=Actinomadura sp. WMMB 499 TaxID=1219491 RepID=UPI00124649B0|nr:triose-phosphate isomerase family protein [Actinomadura sp. WMMB 499]QFG26259.1 triosephosphate isomerase [Actinomadura sp. WMMB 499]
MALPKRLIGVSLKMYLDPRTTLAWSEQVADLARRHPAVAGGDVALFVFPALPALPSVIDVFAGSGVAVGAQDLFWEDRGPYTGGVSGTDLSEIGCTMVEVGHMERRRVFGEDEPTVRRKLAAALRNRLLPVLCVGESTPMPPREAAAVCAAQLGSALAGVTRGPDDSVIVAYEPAWAIGAERSADSDHIGEVTAALRRWLGEAGWPSGHAKVIYGGSAGPGLLGTIADSADGLFLGRSVHEVGALEQVLDEAMAVA